MKWFTWGNTFFTQTEIGLGGKHYHSLYSKLCYTSVSVCQVFSKASFFPKLHFSKSILKEIKGLRLSPISKHVCSEIERTYSSGLSPMLPTAVNNWRRSLQITFFRPIQSEGCVMYYWMSWTHLFTDCFGQSRYQSV